MFSVLYLVFFAFTLVAGMLLVFYTLFHIVFRSKLPLHLKLGFFLLAVIPLIFKTKFYFYYFFLGALWYWLSFSASKNLKIVLSSLAVVNALLMLFLAPALKTSVDSVLLRYADKMSAKLEQIGNDPQNAIQPKIKTLVAENKKYKIDDPKFKYSALAKLLHLVDLQTLDNVFSQEERVEWEKWYRKRNDQDPAFDRFISGLEKSVDLKSDLYKNNSVYQNMYPSGKKLSH